MEGRQPWGDRNDITFTPKYVLQARFPEEVVVAKERVYKMLQDNDVWDSVVVIHLNYRLTVMEMQLTSQEVYERLLTTPLYFKGRDRDILVYFSDGAPSITEVTLNNVPLGMDFNIILEKLKVYGTILTNYLMKSTFGSKTQSFIHSRTNISHLKRSCSWLFITCGFKSLLI